MNYNSFNIYSKYQVNDQINSYLKHLINLKEESINTVKFIIYGYSNPLRHTFSFI